MSDQIFTLEALNAQYGDALILHYGTTRKPKRLLIDGGPPPVYKGVLAPRLMQLVESSGNSRIEHAFVTHLDSDHIAGILQFAQQLNPKSDVAAPAKCTSFWFNVFDDAKKELPPELAELVKVASPAAATPEGMVLASVGEGQKLRDAVKAIPANVNGAAIAAEAPFLFADGQGLVLSVDSQLKVTLVCPSKDHLRKLAEDWKKKTRHEAQAEAAAYADRSVYNLSSLVMVVEAQAKGGVTRRMLLTGDARGDHILDGLKTAGFLGDDPIHFDIFKVSHHGSDRDYTKAFFETVKATHYVISADGKFANPSGDVLEWIAETAGDDYTLHITNQSGTGWDDLEKNLSDAVKHDPELKNHLSFRDPEAFGLKVDLMTPVTF